MILRWHSYPQGPPSRLTLERLISWSTAPVRRDGVPEGGHAPETRAASLDMPQHHPACMRARYDAPVALLPPSAPVLPNPVAFDHGI